MGIKNRRKAAKEKMEADRQVKRKAAVDLLYLVACAIDEVVPERAIVENMRLANVYAMSSYHNLTAMTCMALEQTVPDTEILRKWQEKKNQAVRKNILFDVERARLCAFLDSRGIWYLPLKGIVLKDLYSKAGMRQMSDNDILIDAAFAEEVRDWFVENGYLIEEFGDGGHDVYQKPPIYNFEMHTALFYEGHDPLWVKYYETVRERLLPDGNGSMGLHFRDEDFYIYITLHEYKHYRNGGTGLRSLVDVYLYNREKGRSLDRAYIKAELEKLKGADFEEASRTLAEKLFSDPRHCTLSWIAENLSEKEQRMLDYYLFSGTYGTRENAITNRIRMFETAEGEIRRSTKLRYYLRRVFPEMSYYRDNFPFIYRHKYLIPFFLIYRGVIRIADHGGDLWREAKTIWKS